MLSISDGFGKFPDEVPDVQVPEQGLPVYIQEEISELINFTSFERQKLVFYFLSRIFNACVCLRRDSEEFLKSRTHNE